MKLKKVMAASLLATICVCGPACSHISEDSGGEVFMDGSEMIVTEASAVIPTEAPTQAVEYSKVKVDEGITYQTWESFGVSGAWWAQYVGGWDQPYKDNELATREQIARYLYSADEGIGLTSYRYNLGAGSVEAANGNFWYPERRAESFETEPGVYDFSKDANAQWFLKRVVELTEGNVDIVLFCNSPLCRLTVNGMAQMTKDSKVNILPGNYDDFATYVLYVAEHFVAEGIPVSDISPINEPQWEWNDGQEGCHYEPAETAAVLRTFVEEIAERENLAGVKISGPESGEWGGTTKNYINEIMQDEVLKNYFEVLDCHSYWTNTSTKKVFKNWLDATYPDMHLRTSEWVEMVNGTDYTMDSAFNMADVIFDDLTILDVVAWQYWVGVANGDYRDGLIYVNTKAKACRPAKRLWGFGNFTKFIRPGYTRVECSNAYSDLYGMKSVAFQGVNEEGQEELVIVLINRGAERTFQLDLSEASKYNYYEIHTTNENRNLELTSSGVYEEKFPFTIEEASIVTLRVMQKDCSVAYGIKN